MPRLEEYLTFCKVVEQKSFSRAAVQLGLSQPAISQQVRSLESIYGVQLLHRDGFEVLPTDAGQIVYAFACQLVQVYEKSKQEVVLMSGRMVGELSIGASTGPGEYLVPLLLGKFKASYPQVHIAMRVDDSNDIIQEVFNHRFEMAFVGIFRRDRHLHFEPYIHDELVLVVNPNHPWVGRPCISFEELQSLPLILQQQGSGANTVLQEAMHEHGFELRQLNVVMELGLQESTKAAVRAGYGATIISHLGVKEELERGTLVQLQVEGLRMNRNIYICYYRSSPLSTLAQIFLDFAGQYKETLFAA